MAVSTHYFLGANTPGGFYSLYDELIGSDSVKFLYVIKSGPGCGKSGFMKYIAQIAQTRGFDVEYIWNPENPDMLDGILIPASGIAYVDGGVPHVIEPPLPGVNALYLNLSDYYISPYPASLLEDARALDRGSRSAYARAVSFIAAAEKIGQGLYAPLFSGAVRAAIEKRAAGIASREFPSNGGNGTTEHRFLSAFTCEGIVTCIDTVETLCGRVCTIDNEFGFAPLMLEHLAAYAAKAGLHTVRCLSPLAPDELRQLLVPELKLAFLSVSPSEPYDGEAFKHVRLDALIDRDVYRQLRCSLRAEKKLCDALLETAQAKLFEAKTCYCKLDELMTPLVDFDGIYALAKKHAEML